MIELVIVAALFGGIGALIGRGMKAVGKKPLPLAAGPAPDRAEAVRRVLKHLERKTIAELVEGTAAVIDGTVRQVAPLLHSPIYGQPCIGYHLDLRTWADHELRFATLQDEHRCADFEIEDATGIIRVSGAGLELAITDGPFHYYQFDFPPSVAARFHPGFTGPVTVEEGIVVAGARILVCGVVTSELAATDYRDGTPVYTLRASPSFPLVASTDADLFLAGDRPIAPEELHRRR